MRAANKLRRANVAHFDLAEALKSNPKVDPEELARIRQRLELAQKSGIPARRRCRVAPPGSRRRVRIDEDAKLATRTVELSQHARRK